MFAGCVVFSIIGFMACDAQVPIDQAIDAGKTPFPLRAHCSPLTVT